MLTLGHEYDADTQAAMVAAGSAEGAQYGTVETVGFCRNEAFDWLATGCMDGRVCIWGYGANAGQLRFTCVLPSATGGVAEASGAVQLGNGGVTQLKWHPDPAADPVIFTVMSSGIACVWDARTGSALRVLHGHGDMVIDLAVTLGGGGGGGPFVLSCSDGTPGACCT